MVLLEKIIERFVGELLKVSHGVAAQELERLPRLVVDLDSLAWHRR